MQQKGGGFGEEIKGFSINYQEGGPNSNQKKKGGENK